MSHGYENDLYVTTVGIDLTKHPELSLPLFQLTLKTTSKI